VEAQGGNIEPFLYLPLLWLTRRRPVWFGAIAAVGILNRQFTLYGITALAGVALIDRSIRPTRRALAIAAATFLIICGAIEILATRADVLGPRTGTDGETMRAGAIGAVTKRVGWHPADVPQNVRWLVEENLPALFGAPRAPQSEFIETTREAAPVQVWWILAAALAATPGVVWLARSGQCRARVYLMLVCAQLRRLFSSGVDVRANARPLILLALFSRRTCRPSAMESSHRRAKRPSPHMGRDVCHSHARLIQEYLTDRPNPTASSEYRGRHQIR
jgi:hypothetical protein